MHRTAVMTQGHRVTRDLPDLAAGLLHDGNTRPQTCGHGLEPTSRRGHADAAAGTEAVVGRCLRAILAAAPSRRAATGRNVSYSGDLEEGQNETKERDPARRSSQSEPAAAP
jgi:hypothetical protein